MADLSVGSRAPSSRFTDPSGKVRSLDEVLAAGGGKPTLLVFFKTSCPVCQLDFPYLERLHRAHGGAVRVVGVSQDDAAATGRFYAENGKASFDALHDPEPSFDASNAYGVEAVPHHVLLDPGGVVKKVFAGWDRKAIEELDRTFAAAGKKPPAGVVPEGDPVPSFKPG